MRRLLSISIFKTKQTRCFCCQAFRGSVLHHCEYPQTETSEQPLILMNTNTSWPQIQDFHERIKKGWQSEDGNWSFIAGICYFGWILNRQGRRDKLASWGSSNKKHPLVPNNPSVFFHICERPLKSTTFVKKHIFLITDFCKIH